MDTRINALYGRQSVDRSDSISIESQLEFCTYELKGAECKTYVDKGYSGKNFERPDFQRLLQDIKLKLISRVIVYKLDRISRSILDFCNLMELFQEYGVEFVSCTEKFDTSTPMGRAMLNICIVFAQLERETIQKRVADAYASRSKKGLYMGGRVPAGYKLEPYVMNGVNTKRLVVDPVQAALVKKLFEMYAELRTSYGDIVRFLQEDETQLFDRKLTRSTISSIFKNPIYMRADLEAYEFFKGQGAQIANDAADFAGTNGCYFFTGKDAPAPKYRSLQGHLIVLAPSEGLISSQLWLTCRRKLLNHSTYQPSKKVKHTWLSGKVKCGNCGYSLDVIKSSQGKRRTYFRCARRCQCLDCVGCGTLRTADLELFIYNEMVRKLKEFQVLTSWENSNKSNPKLAAFQSELASVEAEADKLIESLSGANQVLIAYANKRILELDSRRHTLIKSIADLSAQSLNSHELQHISNYLDNWDSISFDDKRLILDSLILRISATSELVEIQWKI